MLRNNDSVSIHTNDICDPLNFPLAPSSVLVLELLNSDCNGNSLTVRFSPSTFYLV